MTALYEPQANTVATPEAFVLGTPRLFAGIHHPTPMTYVEHRATDGALVFLDQQSLCREAQAVGMLGRGGAAFPVATKLAATPAGAATEVLINASESDPSSVKDRTLMRLAPHRVIDGALVVANALRTRRITIAVHDQYAARILAAACQQRADAGDVRVAINTGGFVAGEARALIKTLDGKNSVPDGRRVMPHVSGLGDHPTFVSNLETFAQLAQLARLGAARFASESSAVEAGTSLVTLIGNVPTPGVVEVPHGTALSRLTSTAPGDAVLVGGYHGSWTRIDGLNLDRVALRERVGWGASVLAVLPEGTCALGEVASVAAWLAMESAGQCGPCVFGLASLANDLESLHAGKHVDVAAVRHRAGLVDGRGACAHPTGAVRFISSALSVFADELERHRIFGGCGRPTLGILPVPAAASTRRAA
jgi:NADH:ubiquinone oxidoreductase subunit F (NADH-binding)